MLWDNEYHSLSKASVHPCPALLREFAAWVEFHAAAAAPAADADAGEEEERRVPAPVTDMVMGVTLPTSIGGERHRFPRIVILGYTGDLDTIMRKNERVRAIVEFSRARAEQLKDMLAADCYAAVDAMTPRLSPSRPVIVSGSPQYAVNSDGPEPPARPPPGGFDPLPGSFSDLARQKKEINA